MTYVINGETFELDAIRQQIAANYMASATVQYHVNSIADGVRQALEFASGGNAVGMIAAIRSLDTYAEYVPNVSDAIRSETNLSMIADYLTETIRTAPMHYITLLLATGHASASSVSAWQHETQIAMQALAAWGEQLITSAVEAGLTANAPAVNLDSLLQTVADAPEFDTSGLQLSRDQQSQIRTAIEHSCDLLASGRMATNVDSMQARASTAANNVREALARDSYGRRHYLSSYIAEYAVSTARAAVMSAIDGATAASMLRAAVSYLFAYLRSAEDSGSYGNATHTAYSRMSVLLSNYSTVAVSVVDGMRIMCEDARIAAREALERAQLSRTLDTMLTEVASYPTRTVSDIDSRGFGVELEVNGSRGAIGAALASAGISIRGYDGYDYDDGVECTCVMECTCYHACYDANRCDMTRQDCYEYRYNERCRYCEHGEDCSCGAEDADVYGGAGSIPEHLHYASTHGAWRCKSDCSVNSGFELVSPVLYGEAGIAEVAAVCRMLEYLGVTADSSCGLHVHHSADGMTIGDARRLVVSYQAVATAIDSILASDRTSAAENTYAAPYPDRELAMLFNHGAAEHNARGVTALSRYRTVNLDAITAHGTVEFRQHHGTVNAARVTAWIRLTQAFMVRAMQESDALPVMTNMADVCNALAIPAYAHALSEYVD